MAKSNLREVHQSEIKAFRHCRQLHDYRYVQNLQRRKRPQPLIRGTIIHRMVEYFQHGKDPFLALKEAELEFGKLFREEREEYGDLIGDIRRLMTGYFEWYKRDPVLPIKIKGKLAVEIGFKVELIKGVLYYGGKIDAVAQTRDKRKWIKDTKSHKTLPEGDVNVADLQTILYAWALEKAHGIVVDGIAWDYVRYKAPTIPELLKSGELSRSKIDTLWPVYLDEIKRHKLDPRDYKEMEKKLEGKEASFYVRAYLPYRRDSALVKTVLKEAERTSLEILEGKAPVRNLGRHCGWCEMKALCHAELRGLDASFIRKKEYQEKRDAEETQVEE